MSSITDHMPKEAEIKAEEVAKRIRRTLEERKFDPSKEPPPSRPIFSLRGETICTAGNVTTVESAVKTGKSAVVGAMVASTLPHSGDADCLGFTSSNASGHAVLWFDSEQSPEDFWKGALRGLKRAGLSQPPAWLQGFCLTGLGFFDSWQCVLEAIRLAKDAHGGIHSIFLDGAADFVADVNDAKESNAFAAELQGLAIDHDCTIITVIHFNPGTVKSRGHLGSQLERKAESNLQLDKKNGITRIWSDKQRGAPIPKALGIGFAWSDAAGMHVSLATINDERAHAQWCAMRSDADAAFRKAAKTALTWKELVGALREVFKLSDGGARKRIAKLVVARVISKQEDERYVLTPPTPQRPDDALSTPNGHLRP